MKRLPPYKEYFNAQSLSRALEYNNDDDIKIISLSESKCTAYVNGSAKYKISIAWDKEDYAQLECSCPYDYGGYCKHLAAVLMYLEEFDEIETKSLIKNKNISTPKKQTTIKAIINAANKPELVNFIKLLLELDPDLEPNARAFLSKKTTKTKRNYAQKVSRYLRKQEDQEFGHLDWRALSEINRHFDGLINALKASGKNDELLDLSVEIVVQINSYLHNTDDSHGELQYTIHTALSTIESMVDDHSLTSDQKTILFDKLTSCLDNKYIYNFDVGTNIWELIAKTVSSTEQYNHFIHKMNTVLKTKENEWQKEYYLELIVFTSFKALMTLGREQDAQKLLLENIKYDKIRQHIVEQLVNKKEYESAKAAILDGIDIANKQNHSGTVSRWEGQLLDIAILENNNNDIILLAKHNLLDHHFDINNYKLYKQYSPTSNWSKLRTDIIKDLKSRKRGLNPKDLMTIYNQENMIPELFETIEDYGVDFYNLDDYFDVLESHDKDRLIILYIERVKIFLANRTGRKYYKVAVRYIRKLKNMGADEKVTDLVAELRKVHIRRPALLQEFIGL